VRILHISTRLILGGSQENTFLSCEGQARRGHEVHLAFGPIYGPEGSLLARVQAFNNRCSSGEEHTPDGGVVRPIRTHTIQNLVRDVALVTDWRCLEELRALIRTISPDIVHTHSSKAGILGRIAAWDSRFGANDAATGPNADSTHGSESRAAQETRQIGIVHTIHGPPFMPIDGGPFNRLKRRINNAIYTFAERCAARRCHAIVSVADAMTEQYLTRGIGRREQYTTVRSGMEIDTFLHAANGEDRDSMRRVLGLTPGDFVIGTVARLAEHKGHDDLLDSLADDLKENPHWKLLWVGDGWWRERLLAKARAMNLGVAELDKSGASPPQLRTSAPPQVFLTGLVPPERVAAYIRAMDVLVHPSYREGLPRTVPQALLCGVCPVAYDVDGTREACRNGETGLLVPVGDLKKLREAIAGLVAAPELRQRLAANGRAWCAKAFSVDVMIDDLERVYGKALTN
jgi:glycosyltransferase involved in cell wall biosynthesis